METRKGNIRITQIFIFALILTIFCGTSWIQANASSIDSNVVEELQPTLEQIALREDMSTTQKNEITKIRPAQKIEGIIQNREKEEIFTLTEDAIVKVHVGDSLLVTHTKNVGMDSSSFSLEQVTAENSLVELELKETAVARLKAIKTGKTQIYINTLDENGKTVSQAYPVVVYTSIVYDANTGIGQNEAPELVLYPSTNEDGSDARTDETVVAQPVGITKEGHNFVTWNTKPDGSGVNFLPGDIIKTGVYTEDVTLYAIWEAQKYTVEFRDALDAEENHAGELIASNVVSYGQEVIAPITPNNKVGYRFGGWDREYTDIQADTVVYAVYKPIQYTVTYDRGATDVIGTMANSVHDYDTSKNILENTYTRPGYRFDAWLYESGTEVLRFEDGASIYNLTQVDGEQIILKANWIKEENSNSQNIDTQETQDYDISTPPIASDDIQQQDTRMSSVTDLDSVLNTENLNHTDDMKISDNISNKTIPSDTKESTEPTELNANVNLNHTELETSSLSSFESVSESIQITNQIIGEQPIEKEMFYFRFDYITNADNIQIPMPLESSSKTEHNFSMLGTGTIHLGEIRFTSPGIYKYILKQEIGTKPNYKYDQGKYELVYVVTSNAGKLEISKTWYKDGVGVSEIIFQNQYLLPRYTIDFDITDGEYLPEPQYIQHGGFAIKPVNPQRVGYTFAGWTLDGENEYLFSTAVTENFTLKAMWDRSVHSVEFRDSLDADTEFADTLLQEQKVDNGAMAVEVSPPNHKKGYVFDRWDTRFKEVHKDLVIRPIYRPIEYTVDFYGNAIDVQGTTLSQRYSYDEESKLPVNGYYRSGYIFLGWSTIPGDILMYPDRSRILNLSDTEGEHISLYAVWKKQEESSDRQESQNRGENLVDIEDTTRGSPNQELVARINTDIPIQAQNIDTMEIDAVDTIDYHIIDEASISANLVYGKVPNVSLNHVEIKYSDAKTLSSSTELEEPILQSKIAEKTTRLVESITGVSKEGQNEEEPMSMDEKVVISDPTKVNESPNESSQENNLEKKDEEKISLLRQVLGKRADELPIASQEIVEPEGKEIPKTADTNFTLSIVQLLFGIGLFGVYIFKKNILK